MDNQRLFLFFAMAAILMLIWRAWEQENALPPTPVAEVQQKASAESRGLPPVPVASPTPDTVGKPPAPTTEKLASASRITVVTNLLTASIDTLGGDLRELDLLRYPVALDTPDKPFRLMSEAGEEIFIAQSGLIGREGEYPNHKTLYSTEASRYTLAEGQTELRVPLTWRAPNGVRYTKTYVFHRNSYVIDTEFTVLNGTSREWSGYAYGQFQRAHVEHSGFLTAVPSYTGGAIYTPANKYEKISFSDMTSKPLSRESEGGWVAMLQHYFVGSWLIPAKERNQLYSDVLGGSRHVIGFKNVTPATIAPGQSGTLRLSLYAGPKEHNILKQLPEGMDLTVDFGWLTVIAAPIYWLLGAIHRLLGNWGWAIILLTVLIKAAFYPLSATSYKSMAHMRKMQPKMAALKERYGDDRQKLNQAMMELYKTEKINPLGGCLPILVQIPVFIALYWVLLESVEMRQAPWILWIKDLSAQDPYYILPLIMGVSMFVQQKLNPQPLDPIQKKVFMVMPFMFTAMFLFFPAGLVLYWTVNNTLSIAQQWQINRALGANK
jgi:YidC/Oxa1 family membrane protein insertase